MKTTIITKNPEETIELATVIGKELKGGEVIELNSELGGGKTTFTKGLALGIGSDNLVASPTFTISRVYHGKKLTIYHFDFYRLNEPGLMSREIAETATNPNNVLVVEWPEIVEGVLSKDRLNINIEYNDENSRKIHFTYPKSLSYLLGKYASTNN